MSASTSRPEYARSGQTTGRRLELWVRSSALGGDGISHLVSQARSLAREGDIERVDVEVWDDHVDLSSDLRSHRTRQARARLQEFKRWAWRHGTDLAGFGERRQAARGRLGPEYVTQRVPRVLLAEYEEGVLVNVTPCSAQERTVSERLDELECGQRSSGERSRLIR